MLKQKKVRRRDCHSSFLSRGIKTDFYSLSFHFDYAEYAEDSCLIPKNTSLVIARVPLATRLVKKAWDPTAEKAAASASARERKNAEQQASNIDLTMMNGTEEEKISAMMKQSTMDYDPRK